MTKKVKKAEHEIEKRFPSNAKKILNNESTYSYSIPEEIMNSFGLN